MRRERSPSSSPAMKTASEVDLKEGKAKFGDAKAADIERIKALLRRLNETCDVVNPFARARVARFETSTIHDIPDQQHRLTGLTSTRVRFPMVASLFSFSCFFGSLESFRPTGGERRMSA